MPHTTWTPCSKGLFVGDPKTGGCYFRSEEQPISVGYPAPSKEAGCWMTYVMTNEISCIYTTISIYVIYSKIGNFGLTNREDWLLIVLHNSVRPWAACDYNGRLLHSWLEIMSICQSKAVNRMGTSKRYDGTYTHMLAGFGKDMLKILCLKEMSWNPHHFSTAFSKYEMFNTFWN